MAGLAVVLVAGGWYAVHKYRARGAAAGEYIFATVERGDIEDLVTATGSLQPRDYVDVGAQVSGQVKSIIVEVGGEVKSGDLLAEIDATQSEARVQANRASLRAQESQLLNQTITYTYSITNDTLTFKGTLPNGKMVESYWKRIK